ncbi:MAG: hypothetical protein WBF06_05130, partial [Candidatus Acidiferrales bacterium]
MSRDTPPSGTAGGAIVVTPFSPAGTETVVVPLRYKITFVPFPVGQSFEDNLIVTGLRAWGDALVAG